MTLLGYERATAAATLPIRYQAELDRLLLLAKERGLDQDPVIRQTLAWCYSKVQIMRYIGMRMLTQFLHGHQPGPDAAISKLYWSEYHQVVTELASTSSAPRRWCRPGASRRPRSRPTTPGRRTPRLVGRHLPQRPGRHDLRRLVADPAQHHRRDGPRPAEGTEACVIPMVGGSRPAARAVADRAAAVAAADAVGVVAPPAVPAGAAAGLRALPPAHPVWDSETHRIGCRCGELPLVVPRAQP